MSLTLMVSPKNSVTWSNPTPTVTVNGNTYVGGAILAAAGDVSALTALGYVTVVLSGLTAANAGPTASRPIPTNAGAGALWIDTTANVVVASDGLAWRSVATGAIS